MNWTVRGSPQYNALMQQQQDEMTNSVNGLAQSYVPDLSWSPAMNYGALGFQGEGFNFDPAAAVSGSGSGYTMTPELMAYLEQGGYQPAFTEGGQGAYSQARYGIAGADGSIVPGTEYTTAADTGSDLRDFAMYSAMLYGAGTGLQGGIDGLAAGGGTQGAAGADMGAMMAGSADGGALAASGQGLGGAAAATPTITTTMGAPAGGAAGGAAGGGGLGSMFSNMGASDWGRLAQAGIGAYATNRASAAAQEGQQQSNALMREMWQANQAENAPLVALRNSTLPKINALMQNPSSITQDPGYQFGLNQGQTQLDNQAAARGGYYSGAQLKGAAKFNQDYAGTKLDQSLNRLMGVAGLGQVGSTANQGANNQLSINLGQGLQNSGNIRGSGYLGQAGAINSGIGNTINDWQNQWAWNQYGGKP